jgi:hypothetical protein
LNIKYDKIPDAVTRFMSSIDSIKLWTHSSFHPSVNFCNIMSCHFSPLYTCIAIYTCMYIQLFFWQ